MHPETQRQLTPCRFHRVAGLFALAILPVLAACDNALLSSAGGGAGQFDGAAPLAAPAPAELGDAPGAATAGDALREIEEADVIKLVGDKMYLLNRHKGLIVVDVADPDNPTVAGSTELRGRPIEMFVVGSRAFVVLSADFGYGTFDNGVLVDGPALRILPPAPDFDGSQVAIVDVSAPEQPTVLGKISLAGFASQSRRVGDVLYIAGRNLPSAATDPQAPGEPPIQPGSYEEPRGFIASINVADPADIRPIDRQTFRGGSVDMHVSTEAIFAARGLWDNDLAQTFTRVQYVDISDPSGLITVRGAVDVPGRIRNRFYMDDYQGTFRIATESGGFGFREVRMFTYDIADPDAITPLGETLIISGETLEAVRFDGPRAYAVTFLRVDPLFVVDLSDPTAPVVSGELEVPGFSTHIEPRGDRLIAIGIDDTAGRRPAVAYYDVSDPANPSQLGRVVLGPPFSFTESEAVYDEKAFKIIDHLNLILIPFSHVEYPDIVGDPMPGPMPPPSVGGAVPPGEVSASFAASRPKCINAVQLVDFSDAELVQRGWFDARARVHRVGVIGDRVFAASQVSLETVDISDRDNPVSAGEAAFFDAEEMTAFETGCGNVFIDPVPMPGTIPIGLDTTVGELIRLLMQETDMCGTLAAMPMMGLVVGMSLMRRGRRRPRR